MTATNPFLRALPALPALLAATLLLAAPARAQTTIADAREQGVGATVTVDGVVTRAFGDFVRLQDESGPTGASALIVRQPEGDFFDDVQDGVIRAGTRLQVTGVLSDFNGLIQINEDDLASYAVNGQGAVPAPQDVALADLQGAGGEDYESELVRVEGLRLPGARGVFVGRTTYEAEGEAGATLGFRVQAPSETALAGLPVPDGPFPYTGVVGQFNGDSGNDEGYQLIPIRRSDVGTSAYFGGRAYALLYEEGGDGNATAAVRVAGLPEGETLTVTATRADESPAEASDLSGFSEQELTFTGPNPAPQTLSFAIAGDDETEGIERFEVALQPEADSVNASQRLTLWLLDDSTAQTTLYAGLEGAALLDRLREDFAAGTGGAPGPPTLGYDVARDTLYGVVFNDEGLVNGYYTGLEATLGSDPDPSTAVGDDGINTEHLWPRSQGAENPPAVSNMHILAPAWSEANSARNNYPFAEIDDGETERWFTADGSGGVMQNEAPPEGERDAWTEFVGGGFGSGEDGLIEPREVVEGNAARKAFYFVMAYPDRFDADFFDVQKDALRGWHDQDPVGATEQRRNVLVASYQGDRLNPFQLDSSLVRRAFFPDSDSGETLDVSVTRSFGDPDAPEGYRLVALPGDADRPLAETLDGTAGDAWQAYRDDGSAEDYLVAWSDAEAFRFRPGRGFWLLAESDWTVEAEIPAVEPAEDGRYAIALRDGWNIVSNPRAGGLAWSAVQAANGGDLEPLWGFSGSFMQAETFASATGGRAFYFLNNTGLDELVLPAPGGEDASAVASTRAADGAALTLTTYRDGRRTSAARVGTAPGATAALDVHDDFAPPGRFAGASLRLPQPDGGPSAAPRQAWLADERRAPDQDGYAFDLVLRADPGDGSNVSSNAPVTLRASGLGAFAGKPVQLLEPATGETHDLRATGEVTITPAPEGETPLRLLVGNAADAASLPDEVALRPGYPNPFREQVTLEYALPEETHVRVAVYDLLGRRVRTLADGRRAAGTHTLRWDGRASGGAMASGVYFVRLTAAGVTRSEKVVRVQ